MKKNLTKLVSILMVLVMMVGLSGCSNEKNAVLGSWKASMNLAEYLNQGIAQEDATAAEYLSVDSFYLTMVLTFKEDNTYTLLWTRTPWTRQLSSSRSIFAAAWRSILWT